MFAILKVRRRSDRPITRRERLGRRPLVEALEGRQFQSGLALAHLAPIVGAHIGMAAVPGGGGVGRHIG